MSLQLRVSRAVAIVVVLAAGVALLWAPWSIDVEVKPRTTKSGSAGGKSSPRLTRAKAAGRAYWGKVPCSGNVTYRIAHLKDDYIGYAQWDDPEHDGPPYVNCLILYERDVFGPGHRAPYWLFCGVTLHEDGHTLGHSHVRDPDDVMYPRTTQRNVPAICKRGQDQADTGPVPPGRW